MRVYCTNIKKYFLFVDKLEQAKFIESKFGKLMLLDRNGQVFTCGQGYKQGGKNWWRCREYMRKKGGNQEKCPAKATTDGMNVLSWRYEHNH